VAIPRGRASVIDGRTLWFRQPSIRVRLAEIDACELPQWGFDPQTAAQTQAHALAPVPCGSLAKAWLKRVVGNSEVQCRDGGYAADGALQAHCFSRGHDIALELLRVGWARVLPTAPADPRYRASQKFAISARYGMWATYVLDMNEWRRKAVDRTTARRPIADFNLLVERESEISPPFADARHLPGRKDR